MRRYGRLIPLALVLALMGLAGGTTKAPGAAAAADRGARAAANDPAFLKIAGIQGGSAVSGFEGWIDIETWGWSETNPPGAGTAPRIRDFNFIVAFSKASPQLFLATASGRHFLNAKLVVERGQPPAEYLTVTMNEVVVTSYETEGRGEENPTDTFSISFSKIRWVYTDAHGITTACWNVDQNRQC